MYFKNLESYKQPDPSIYELHDNIIYCLLVEHVMSYSCYMFRRWEIRRNGTADVYGIYRAPYETMLQILEIFIDSMLFGYILKHMLILTHKEFH